MTQITRYRDLKPTESNWIGVLPAHWSLKKLKFVATYKNSNVDKHSVDEEVPVRLCNYTDVYYNEKLPADLPFMEATASEKEVRDFSLRLGDIIITKDSEDAEDIGIPGIVVERLDGVVCGYHLTIIRAGREIFPAFLFRVLQAEVSRRQFQVSAAGVTRYGLGQGAIGNLEVPVPSIGEQRTIAAFLDHETARIDRLIEKQQRLIVLLEEKRQAVISHAVTKGLDPNAPMKDSGVEWIGRVPDGWNVAKIRWLAQLESGHTPSRSHPEYWENCAVPWFTLSDIWQIRQESRVYVTDTKEKVSELGLANSSARLLPAGTVILSRTASVGFPAIMSVDMATSQDFANWICGPRLRPQFLYFVLKAMGRELRRLMMGSTHKTIYMPDIHELATALPPVDEQDRILATLNRQLPKIDALVQRNVQLIDKLGEHRAALISAAVTGQIDVRDWQPTVEEPEPPLLQAAEEPATYG